MASNNNPNEMDDLMRQEWSRHYDNLLWTVITIFTVGVGAAFAYSMIGSLTLWPEITGVALSLLGVFWVAGFRSFRSNLHGGIKNKGLYNFLADPEGKGRKFLTQWNVFVFSFAVVSVVFTYKLAAKTVHFLGVFWVGLLSVVGSLLVLLVFWLIWKMGKSESRH